MTDDTLLPFDLPSVCRKKITVDFNGGTQSSNGGLLLLREKERTLGVCWRLASTMTVRRDPNRIGHEIWTHHTGVNVGAPPMSYAVNGRQFVAVATGTAAGLRPGGAIMASRYLVSERRSPGVSERGSA
jgi:hypothetical protein